MTNGSFDVQTFAIQHKSTHHKLLAYIFIMHYTTVTPNWLVVKLLLMGRKSWRTNHGKSVWLRVTHPMTLDEVVDPHIMICCKCVALHIMVGFLYDHQTFKIVFYYMFAYQNYKYCFYLYTYNLSKLFNDPEIKIYIK